MMYHASNASQPCNTPHIIHHDMHADRMTTSTVYHAGVCKINAHPQQFTQIRTRSPPSSMLAPKLACV
eukprot:11194012-Lingulodinium_polyedra.AAC.1